MIWPLDLQAEWFDHHTPRMHLAPVGPDHLQHREERRRGIPLGLKTWLVASAAAGGPEENTNRAGGKRS